MSRYNEIMQGLQEAIDYEKNKNENVIVHHRTAQTKYNELKKAKSFAN